MHDRKTLAKLNDRAVELAARRKREALQLAHSKAFDLWPGDTADFDGAVHYDERKADRRDFDGSGKSNRLDDATPEYAGSRAQQSVIQQLDGRPITIPSDRPIVIRLVDIKIRDSHPSR
jgi:hypothetical protein